MSEEVVKQNAGIQKPFFTTNSVSSMLKRSNRLNLSLLQKINCGLKT